MWPEQANRTQTWTCDINITSYHSFTPNSQTGNPILIGQCHFLLNVSLFGRGHMHAKTWSASVHRKWGVVPTGDTAADLLSAVYEQLGIGSVTAGFKRWTGTNTVPSSLITGRIGCKLNGTLDVIGCRPPMVVFSFVARTQMQGNNHLSPTLIGCEML